MNEFKTTAAMEMYIQTGRNVEHDLTVRGFQELCEEQFHWEAPMSEDDGWMLAEDQSTIWVEMSDFESVPRFHEWTVTMPDEENESIVRVQLSSYIGTRAMYFVRLK